MLFINRKTVVSNFELHKTRIYGNYGCLPATFVGAVGHENHFKDK
jgi:hypothetical protein